MARKKQKKKPLSSQTPRLPVEMQRISQRAHKFADKKKKADRNRCRTNKGFEDE